VFQRSDRKLADHPITRGRNRGERIDSVRTFTGEAFRALVPRAPLLVLAPETIRLFPNEAWKFSDATPRVRADGLRQGAALTIGRGRVAVFGEAAMFSAQVSGPERRPMGMNTATAAQNPQFLRMLCTGWQDCCRRTSRSGLTPWSQRGADWSNRAAHLAQLFPHKRRSVSDRLRRLPVPNTRES
jgi:hypothetical protein